MKGSIYAKEKLSQYPVEELKNARAGIRVQALEEAGYRNLEQLIKASDLELRSIEGIGDRQIESIRHIVTEFANSLAGSHTIRLEAEDGLSVTGNSQLVFELYRYLKCEAIRKDSADAAGKLKEFCAGIDNDRMITSGFGWLFSGSRRKMETVRCAGDIYTFYTGPFFERLLHLIDMYNETEKLSVKEAMDAFKLNGADFYALLERIDSTRAQKSFVYDSIPSALANEIDSVNLDLSSFSGNLRSYQSFGVKYILHQKYVLLGDEMGLGKTIQAIAAMSHISASGNGKDHFLIIHEKSRCPEDKTYQTS